MGPAGRSRRGTGSWRAGSRAGLLGREEGGSGRGHGHVQEPMHCGKGRKREMGDGGV